MFFFLQIGLFITEQQYADQNLNEITSMNNKFHKPPIDTLDDPQRVAVTQAIANVLSTEIAERASAQIQDGLPLAEVVDDTIATSCSQTILSSSTPNSALRV